MLIICPNAWLTNYKFWAIDSAIMQALRRNQINFKFRILNSGAEARLPLFKYAQCFAKCQCDASSKFSFQWIEFVASASKQLIVSIQTTKNWYTSELFGYIYMLNKCKWNAKQSFELFWSAFIRSNWIARQIVSLHGLRLLGPITLQHFGNKITFTFRICLL